MSDNSRLVIIQRLEKLSTPCSIYANDTHPAVAGVHHLCGSRNEAPIARVLTAPRIRLLDR